METDKDKNQTQEISAGITVLLIAVAVTLVIMLGGICILVDCRRAFDGMVSDFSSSACVQPPLGHTCLRDRPGFPCRSFLDHQSGQTNDCNITDK